MHVNTNVGETLDKAYGEGSTKVTYLTQYSMETRMFNGDKVAGEPPTLKFCIKSFKIVGSMCVCVCAHSCIYM